MNLRDNLISNWDFSWMPSDPLTDTPWILMLQRIYAHPTATPGG